MNKKEEEENLKKVSTDSYKGVRDFYPKDWLFQKWLFWQMASSAELFGYENYAASPLEYTQLYTAKSGPEIVSECYNMVDKGDRKITLRPEMTPTLARMIAAQERELPRPIRWYSIPNLFRYEKPQRGRLREHYQFNADIFGVAGIEAEVEMIELGVKICENMGLKSDDFVVKVNNRKITSLLFSIASFASFKKTPNSKETEVIMKEKEYLLAKLFDKKSKISEKEFKDQLKDILKNNKAVEIVEKFMLMLMLSQKHGDILTLLEKITENLLNVTEDMKEEEEEVQENNDEFYHLFAKIEENLKDKLVDGKSAFKKTNELIQKLNEKGIKNVEFDLTLMRGFDYYTDTVFEFFDTHPENNRSMFGGGRYDDLLTIFGKEKIPAVGFGMGDVTAKNSLEVRGIMPETRSKTKVALLPLEKDFFETAEALADFLRMNGVNTEVDYSEKKLVKKISGVEKKEIEFFINIGEDEKEKKEFSMKNIFTGEKFGKLLQEDVLEVLKK